jgi:hypothetical protein
MISQYLDLTNDFNVAGLATIDVGEWDWITVQLVTPAGTVTFSTSNDGGAAQAVTDGNAASAINFIAIQGTNLNTGTTGTTLAASGLMRFAVIGRYLQLSGTTAAKVLVKLSKIE